MPCLQQHIRQLTADKAGNSGNQNHSPHLHILSIHVLTSCGAPWAALEESTAKDFRFHRPHAEVLCQHMHTGLVSIFDDSVIADCDMKGYIGHCATPSSVEPRHGNRPHSNRGCGTQCTD